MKVRRVLTYLCAGLLFGPSVLWGAQLPEPTVDYSADSMMEMQSHSMKGKVYVSPGKQRQEMGDEGMVMILRRDKQVVWQIMGDMYMELPMGQAEGYDLEQMDVEQTVVGEERVNGVNATKSKVVGTMADGRKFGGFFWTTQEGITVKMDLLMKDGETKERIVLELTNLKIAKQDPTLFEPPPGAVKNEMGAMLGMGKGKGKAKGRGAHKGNPPSLEEMMKHMGGAEGTDDEGGMDINKMMKEMMGR